MKRSTIFLFIFLCFLAGGFLGKSHAEIFGDFPTGLLQLEKKHTYYLFVPPEYSPEKAWPLLVMIGKSGTDPKQLVDSWVEWAKKNQLLVLVPTIFPREGQVPTELRDWLVKLKQDVAQRYRIDSSQVLLVGFESGAQYVAYLGMQYPEEFPAAALVREAWVGPLERLTKPVSNPRKHISFYVAVDPTKEGYSKIERKALEFEKKGYRITFDPLKSDEDFSKLRDRMIQWFREDREAQTALKGKPKLKFKDKLSEFFHDFFEV